MNRLTETFGDSYTLKVYGVVNADILLGKKAFGQNVRFGSSILEMHDN